MTDSTRPRGTNLPPVVYFVQQRTHGPVKIGYSGNMVNRYNTLAVSSPTPLRVRAIIPAKTRDLEILMHERFERYRMYKEWFDIRFADDLEMFMEKSLRMLADYVDHQLPARISAEMREDGCIPSRALRRVQAASSGFDDYLVTLYPTDQPKRTRGPIFSADSRTGRKTFYG